MKLRHGIGAFSAPVCRQLLVVFLPLLCLIAWGCRQVPLGERRVGISPDAPVIGMPEAEEIQLGLTTYREVLQKEPLSENQRYVDMVRRVGERIAAVADRSDYAWEFNVVARDVQNAFALPGGKVVIYEGMLPVCQTEAGLAVVMSHEVAHALARHGGERLAAQRARQLGRIGVDTLGRWVKGDEYDRHQEIVQTVYNVGTEYAGVLPYSRLHESEADQIGLKLMAMAGYDPSEAPRFWERFSEAKSGQQTLEFLSTHPSDARRAADLRARLPEAMRIYEKAEKQHGLGEPVLVESTHVTLPLSGETRLR